MGDNEPYRPFERRLQLVAGLAIFGYRMIIDDQAGGNLFLDAPVNSPVFWIKVLQYSTAIILIRGVKAEDVAGLLKAWRGTK